MKLRFVVHDLPPKKDGATSIWRQPLGVPRLKSLRRAASHALEKRSVPSGLIRMSLTLYALPGYGDLDSFVSGICDGLMAAHPNTLNYIDWSLWVDMPENIHPDKHILFKDDAVITRIVAERFTPDSEPFYELEFEWAKYQVYLGEQHIGQTDFEMRDVGMSVYLGIFDPLPSYDLFRPFFQSYLDHNTKGVSKNPELDAFFQKLESLDISIQRDDGIKIPTSFIQIFDYSAHIPGDCELEIHAQVTDPSKL